MRGSSVGCWNAELTTEVRNVEVEYQRVMFDWIRSQYSSAYHRGIGVSQEPSICGIEETLLVPSCRVVPTDVHITLGSFLT
jgi:hypothetical protein